MIAISLGAASHYRSTIALVLGYAGNESSSLSCHIISCYLRCAPSTLTGSGLGLHIPDIVLTHIYE